MRPDDRDIDEEIRSHIALSVQERIDRGDDPDVARRAALQEFGYVPAIRDSMHRVWFSRWLDASADFARDVRIGLRSLRATTGLAITVIVTLALGIGANAAIFSVVQEVLLRPLVNEDQDRLVYIRQSAPDLATDNVTFSVPEVDDFRSRITTIAQFADFSTIEFTLLGFGDPRVVRAGVVSGAFFDVMGLEPSLGRLLSAQDDGVDAAGAVVLTHRFWNDELQGDPSVIGKVVRLGSRSATIVGVLEPSVPYPADTEIIANIVTSPHHLEATMVTGRTHRMTELFGRLAPGASLEEAREELTAVHAVMKREHPDAYSAESNLQVSATRLRDQIAAPARPVLLILLGAAALVFMIACANVANLILARSVRREAELAVRAALGASRAALRRTLLAESLILCGAGAVLGVVIAYPLVTVVGMYAARFSVRALDSSVDASVLWVGVGLAMIAAVALAFIPRLPSTESRATLVRARGGMRAFAMAQVALSLVLLAGAGTLLATLLSLQTIRTGFDMRVLAIDVPMPVEAAGPQAIRLFDEATTRIAALEGVERVAAGSFVPWRDAGTFGPGFRVAVAGEWPDGDVAHPHAQLRTVAPGYFDVLGVPLARGRDFTADDRRGTALVVIVSEGLARRLFPGTDAVGQSLWWTDPYFSPPTPRRIVGVVADVDDQHVVPAPVPTVYHPFQQLPYASRLFVRASGDVYRLVEPITGIIRELSADQPVERAATLADIRASVLQPERLNAWVVTGFGGVALLIAVVGVAGVMAFSVRARTREFGVRLAIGSTPRHLLRMVLSEAALIVVVGLALGAAAAMALAGPWPILGAAIVLGGAALLASLWPAARAARVNVLEALRSE
jgi:predicted permease